MAKLTLSFKGRLLSVHHLERPLACVGRDPGCDIAIDSLAVAPRHAEIRREDDRFVLVALDRDHLVFRNGQRVERADLAEGDLILIGKHTLSFSEVSAESILLPSAPALAPAPRHRRDEPPEPGELVPVYLQIQSGPHIGHMIPLMRSVTRLTLIGGHEVIVTRRDGHYVLTRIGEANLVFVGRRKLRGDEEVALVSGAPVEVDGTLCQFFCPEDLDSAPLPPDEPLPQSREGAG